MIEKDKGLTVSGTARWMGEEQKGWQELAKKTTMKIGICKSSEGSAENEKRSQALKKKKKKWRV